MGKLAEKYSNPELYKKIGSQAKCSHILGLAYYKDDLDFVIDSTNTEDIWEYSENDITWFKYCPLCRLELLPKHRNE